jgi:crotonobetainyl-CoA:carnitine CoA-transferase CaiB-like acyl-CoA transferase
VNASIDRVLAGLRVLDLLDADGQYCAKLFADLGADVIKVEPSQGDPARQRRPHKDDRVHPDGSLYFAYRNTNKRSLAVSLESAEGQAIVRDLACWADVLLDSPESSPLPRLGLTLERLRELNPGLIVTRLSGVGTRGPYADYRTTSSVVFALSGLMRLIGEPEGPPVAPPEPLAFDLAAVDAAAGALLAILARRRTGRGQDVQVAAVEVLAAQFNVERGEGGLSRRTANLHPELSPSGVYACRDGAVELTIVMPGQWQHLKELLGNPPELADAAWDKPEARRAGADALASTLTSLLRDWPRAELVERAQALQVPCLPVNSVADFCADRHAAARGFFVEAKHAYLGRHQMAGAPYQLSEAGWGLVGPAPRLGEHSRDILTRDLGYPGERVARLVGAGVVTVHPAAAHAGGVASNAPRAAEVALSGGLDDHRPPLDGIRVLAFSTAFAGPTLSRYLADYGADVIKVESRRRPDNTRHSHPRLEPDGSNTSLLFSSFNRNKRDVSINMSDERGRALVRRLVQLSDVVVENFSRRVLPGWGLDLAGLRAIKPDIIVLNMQGTGQTGPYRDYVTYGPALQSYTGLTSLWGYSHSSFVDYIAAQHGVVAVLAALLYRARTGRGLHIDLAQTEAAAAVLGTAYLDYAVNGRVERDLGNRSLDAAPHGCYRCEGEDAWCVIAVPDDRAWRGLRQAMGDPGWAAQPQLDTPDGRRAHAAEVDAALEAWTRTRAARDLERELQASGVPAAAVRSATEAWSDPHLRARDFYVRLEHPVLGPHELPGLPIELSETPGRITRAAPLLGQDNRAVLTGLLGLSDAEVDHLEAQGVLA